MSDREYGPVWLLVGVAAGVGAWVLLVGIARLVTALLAAL